MILSEGAMDLSSPWVTEFTQHTATKRMKMGKQITNEEFIAGINKRIDFIKTLVALIDKEVSLLVAEGERFSASSATKDTEMGLSAEQKEAILRKRLKNIKII